MAVEETVRIHIEIDSDLAADSAKLKALFAMMDREARKSSRSIDNLDRNSNKLNKTLSKADRSASKFGRTMGKLGKVLKNVGSVLSNLLSKFSLFSFIGVAIEIGLISAALLGVKLALVSGRFAVQAYQLALQGLGVTATGVAVVLGSVAAAMRQISEATLAPDIGGYKQAAQTMRSAMSDSQLSFFGMEGVETAVNALARGGVSSEASYTRILKQLGNYTSDPKQLADLASVYADINKSGQISSASFGKLGDINPVLSAGISELSGLSGGDLDKALGEGGAGISSSVFAALLDEQAEATDAWEGQLARLNNTVMGTLKGMIPRLFTLFADLGMPFLDTIQQTLVKIESMIGETVFRIRGAVTQFGLDSLIPGILTGFEKVSDWMVELMRSSSIEGWGDKLGSWWGTIRNYFLDMVEIFKPLEAGADVLMRVLGPQVGGIFDGFARLIKNFSKSLVANEDVFMSFGDAVGRFFESFLSWFDNANDAFVDAIPVWNDLLGALSLDVLPMLRNVFDLMHEASQTVLPVVTKALSAISGALSGVANALTSVLNVPGIGVLLGFMMFKTTRKPLVGLAKGAASLAGYGAVGAGSKAAVGKAAAAGGVATAAFGRSFYAGGFRQIGTDVRGASAAGMGRGAAVSTGLSTLGSVALVAVPSAFAGYGVGTFAGSKIGGAGGVAAGALGGAATGAAIGATIGAALTSWLGPVAAFGAGGGALVGGAIGGVSGGVGAWFEHRRFKKANEAADKLVSEFYDGVEVSLAQGQGRQAIDAAKTEMSEMLENVADHAKELGIDETELRKRLQAETDRLNIAAAESIEILDNRVAFLSRTTGIAALEIERLADEMNVDLSNAAGSALLQLQKLAEISDWQLTLPGIQDNTNQVMWQTVLGAGSVYEQTFDAPEKLDTYQALLNEVKDIKDVGGEVSGQLFQDVLKANAAYRQAEHGEEGSELIAGVGGDLAIMSLLTGADFNQFGPDFLAAVGKLSDPAQNPALMGLEAAILDFVGSSQESIGMSPEWIDSKVAALFADSQAKIDAAATMDKDLVLSQLLTKFGVGADMYTEANTVNVNGQIVRIGGEHGPTAPVPPPGAITDSALRGMGMIPQSSFPQSDWGLPSYTPPSAYASPSVGASTLAANETNINARSNFEQTIHMTGYTDSSLTSKVLSITAEAIRNAAQRSSAISSPGDDGRTSYGRR